MLSLVFKIIGSVILFMSVSFSVSWASTGAKNFQEYSLNSKLDSLPDLRKYPSGTQRKKAFLHAVVPIINRENSQIRQEREWLLTKRTALSWSAQDIAHLQRICHRYQVTCSANPQKIRWVELLKRVDILPTHLVVVQAATESGWGTSKLAQANNNLFGMRCGTKRCNSKEVAVKGYSTYESVDDSVNAYLLNMNTHAAYRTLRDSRANIRNQGDTVTAEDLMSKLDRYSERGSAYKKFLQKILDHNEDLIQQVQVLIVNDSGESS
ncbi:MAG: protein bax [Enterobacteriaceae bacterium]|jgi:Bax protein|nr:protein bax [Enterobacteriaceae bacterium]